MKYKKVVDSFFLCFAIIALCAPGISEDQRVESIWAATPVEIDGLNDEWEGDTLTFKKNVKVDYAFRNDSENLYVLFIFKEPRRFMSTINKTGMTLWLNTEGKKEKNYGIKFQFKTVSADNYISLLEEMMGPISEEREKEIKSRPAYRIHHIELIDKKGGAPLIVSGSSALLFNSWVRLEMVTYEFRIPLKKGKGDPVGIGAEPGKNLKIGFEWGGLTEELKKRMVRLEGKSIPLYSIRRRAKKYSFWAEVKLAQNQKIQD